MGFGLRDSWQLEDTGRRADLGYERLRPADEEQRGPASACQEIPAACLEKEAVQCGLEAKRGNGMGKQPGRDPRLPSLVVHPPSPTTGSRSTWFLC